METMLTKTVTACFSTEGSFGVLAQDAKPGSIHIVPTLAYSIEWCYVALGDDHGSPRIPDDSNIHTVSSILRNMDAQHVR